MSSVRTHFCTLVARGNGGVDCPRKYGLNGTIPATVNSRVGSSLIREADGTTVWPAFSKCPRKRRRISWVCITHLYLPVEILFCKEHRSRNRPAASHPANGTARQEMTAPSGRPPGGAGGRTLPGGRAGGWPGWRRTG